MSEVWSDSSYLGVCCVFKCVFIVVIWSVFYFILRDCRERFQVSVNVFGKGIWISVVHCTLNFFVGHPGACELLNIVTELRLVWIVVVLGTSILLLFVVWGVDANLISYFNCLDVVPHTFSPKRFTCPSAPYEGSGLRPKVTSSTYERFKVAVKVFWLDDVYRVENNVCYIWTNEHMLINITFIDFNWLTNRSEPSVTSVSPVISLVGANQEALVYESIQDFKGDPI